MFSEYVKLVLNVNDKTKLFQENSLGGLNAYGFESVCSHWKTLFDRAILKNSAKILKNTVQRSDVLI